jgi:CheY-like chemotaxis protein
MSHEIRTPMNAIIGMSALALSSTDLTQRQRNYIEKVNVSAVNLLRILNDILDVSKIEAGMMTIELGNFRLDALVSHLAGAMQSKAAEKNIELTFDIAPEVPMALVGDSLRLGQVLLNLVGNALKFTSRGAVAVSVELEEKGNTPGLQEDESMLHFRVADTGIGMSPQTLESLFEPFTQADTSTARTYGGTGLGLTISKNLTELMGGRIWVESEAGRGSTFHFTARLRRQPAGADSTAGAPFGAHAADLPDTSTLQGARVLLVEDNEINQELASELLTLAGVEVDVASDGQQAIDKLNANRYDAVLMDCQMPVMDGYTAAILLRKDPRFATLPIIAMTANAMSTDIQAALDAGMNDHIAKPIDVADMFTVLLSWIVRQPTPG